MSGAATSSLERIRHALNQSEGKSISEILALAGFTHRAAPGQFTGREVVDEQGRVVVTGDGVKAMRWLREQVEHCL